MLKRIALGSVAAAGAIAVLGQVGVLFNGEAATPKDPTVQRADRLIAQGRNIFRYDTFGDEAVWGGVLGLHKAIEGAKLVDRRFAVLWRTNVRPSWKSPSGVFVMIIVGIPNEPAIVRERSVAPLARSASSSVRAPLFAAR